MRDLTQGPISGPSFCDGRADRGRHARPDALFPDRPLFRRAARRHGARGRRRRGHRDVRRDGTDADARRRRDGTRLAGGRAQGPGRRRSRLQPVDRHSRQSARSATIIGGYLLAGWYMGTVGADRANRGGRHDLPLLVHAGARAAVREHRDDVGAARHRRRAADDDRADRDGAAECAARADPDRGLADRPSDGRRRRGPCELDLGRGRLGDARALFPASLEKYIHFRPATCGDRASPSGRA